MPQSTCPVYSISYPQRLQTLGLVSLESRRKREDLINLYKLANNPNWGPTVLTYKNRPGTRGHRFSLYSERTFAAPRRNFLTNRTRPLWNSLSPEAVSAPSVNSFKSHIRAPVLNCFPDSMRLSAKGGDATYMSGVGVTPRQSPCDRLLA